VRPFVNEPVLELRRATERERLLEALRENEPRLPLEVPVWIEDERRAEVELFSSDPGAPERVVARASVATDRDVDHAVRTAGGKGFVEWSALSAEKRAETLSRAAAILRSARPALAALQVRECAKPWGEADADVCEAIDFLEYYARGAVDLAAGRELLQVPGERNTMTYAPRGVVGVISPWNFPLAIPCGMMAAGLATGNAVVLKPAEQAPGSAYRLVSALREAGVPPAALALVPGYGEAGEALVRHPGVHVIAFTGSQEVGLSIIRAAAETPSEQGHVKRVVAEMGGKNCVVVDADADLDEAVPAIVASAFVYAGQKCSAASRVLVHEAVADTLAERLAGAVDVLRVDQAETFGTDVPPVIEREARERVESYAERGAREGRVVAGSATLPPEGWFCSPTVLAELPADSALLREEIFGPVLTLEAVPSVSAACERIEPSAYALTAGLFSRSPATVEEVARRLPVGNFYVNRHITGAMVGRQPFGGNRRSGVGAKAGGPDYLAQFVEPRVVTENTMRHGLVAE